MISEFWRLEVQDQGVGKTMLPLKALGNALFRALSWILGSSLVCGSIIPTFT